jgi:Fe-S-cluster containining protein
MSDDDAVDRRELVQGFLFDHTRINLNTIEIHKALARVEALVAMLTDAGILDEGSFDRRRAEAEERLRQAFVEQGMAVAIQEHDTGKYELDGLPEIDCENRVELCKAACCRLQFALSKEDVEEGVVRWDLGHPYFIAHTSEGSCVHLVPDTLVCGVYKNRPVPCRTYDCSHDSRVWRDFENRIPHPLVGDPDWPHCLHSPGESGEAGTGPALSLPDAADLPSGTEDTPDGA